MAELVQISGLPATGKTTGVKTLNPVSTFFIDGDGKGLSWAGWRKDYNTEAKNYMKASTAAEAYKGIKYVVEQRPEINCIVLDTINTLMNNEEMEILDNPSRDAWADLAISIYKLYKYIREIKGRDDLVVYVMAHVEPYDVNGISFYRMKVPGRKLSKTNLNAHLNYNLYTSVSPTGKPGEFKYELRTNTNGLDEARSPLGMFDRVVPNDLEMVRKTIVESNN